MVDYCIRIFGALLMLGGVVALFSAFPPAGTPADAMMSIMDIIGRVLIGASLVPVGYIIYRHLGGGRLFND